MIRRPRPCSIRARRSWPSAWRLGTPICSLRWRSLARWRRCASPPTLPSQRGGGRRRHHVGGGGGVSNRTQPRRLPSSSARIAWSGWCRTRRLPRAPPCSRCRPCRSICGQWPRCSSRRLVAASGGGLARCSASRCLTRRPTRPVRRPRRPAPSIRRWSAMPIRWTCGCWKRPCGSWAARIPPRRISFRRRCAGGYNVPSPPTVTRSTGTVRRKARGRRASRRTQPSCWARSWRRRSRCGLPVMLSRLTRTPWRQCSGLAAAWRRRSLNMKIGPGSGRWRRRLPTR